MNGDAGRLGLGAFLVAFGAVVLAARADLVDPAVIPPLADAWPLLLVALGIAVIVRAAVPVLGSLVIGTALGVGAGLVLAGGVPSIGCGAPAGEELRAVENGAFAGRADVTLELPCGELAVELGNGDAWSIEAAGDGPEVESGTDELDVTGSGLPFAQGSQRWRVVLPVAAQLDLSTTVNAGRATLALEEARIGNLELTVNAGELIADLDGTAIDALSASVNAGTLRVSVSPGSSVTGELSANAGSIQLCIPAETGLRVRSESTLGGSNLEEAGLTRVGGAWQSASFETAPQRVDVTTSTNLGTLTLNPEGVCPS
jgi:hypothetical protein